MITSHSTLQNLCLLPVGKAFQEECLFTQTVSVQSLEMSQLIVAPPAKQDRPHEAAGKVRRVNCQVMK